ncbi:MAG: lysozyme inhibitor LprI family protein [Stenotrophomonas sp.]
MKRLLTLTLLLAPALPALAQSDCNPAGNQMQLNACAAENLAKADAELNRVYRQVLARHAGEAVALEKIKAAQRVWIQLRDADLAARYPVGKDENPRVLYGSMYPMLYAGAKAALTETRTAFLRKEFLERGEYDL